jgi:hypothetical protein
MESRGRKWDFRLDAEPPEADLSDGSDDCEPAPIPETRASRKAAELLMAIDELNEICHFTKQPPRPPPKKVQKAPPAVKTGNPSLFQRAN